VHLHDARMQLACERRYARTLPIRHRDDDVVRLELLVAGDNEKPIAEPRQTFDARAAPHGQLKVPGVGFEIVAHRVFRRERMRVRWKGKAVEAREARGCEESQRIPSLAPGIADARARIENHERHAFPLQVIADRKACLPATDHHRVDSLSVHVLPLFGDDRAAPAVRASAGIRRPSNFFAWVFLCTS
jgi:hypothetical protein